MTKVIKRGGKVQDFSPSKLKRAIAAAIREAKVPSSMRAKMVREVVSSVSKACRKRKTIKASAIAKLVVTKLRVRSKEAAAKWVKYERRRHKRRTHKKRRTKKKVHHKKKRRR